VGPIPCLVLQEEDTPSTVIPLDGEDITLGSDHYQASIFLDSPSIDPLHSRITRDENGGTWISDLGSVAGTWVNYTPISRNGVRLEAGDLVQIGKLTFRFQPASSREASEK
jgi:pSer/pThr/pTyr-binding forkhead associated (FHA) protein